VGDEGTLLGLKVGAAQDLPIEDALTRLKIVYHYADVMRNCHEVDEIVGHVLDAVFTILQPDRAAVLLRDRKTGALVPAGSRIRGDGGLIDPSASLHISSSILERCMEERRPIVSLNTATDQRFSEAQSVIVERIGSAVACPLVSRGEVFGALYVDTVTREELFGEPELELITGIANQSAMAIATAQRHKLLLEDREVRLQLDVARRIHDKLVPDLGFENPLVRAYGWNRASSQVGGDHFGMFENKKRGPLFTIGDSTGHGIGAALLMSTVRAYLQGTLAAADLPLPELMRTLNSLMTHDCDAGLFVTFLLVRIEAEGPRLRTCVAGHEPPLLYRPSDDEFIETSPGGSPLGLVENAAYEFSDTIALEPGDRLCLFTDGIVEQRDAAGAELGIVGLKRALRRTARLAPRDAVAGIVKMLDDYRGDAPQDDDYTLVLVEVK
jgi:sigma-B regulation protein RsbU (phosphoserine phosphatase)